MMNKSNIGGLSQKEKDSLINLVSEKPDFSDKCLSKFFAEYFLCEALAHKLIFFYKKHKLPQGNKTLKKITCTYCKRRICLPTGKKKNSNFETLDVGVLKNALMHFSINFPDADADALFKSDMGTVENSNRSARRLRNEYVHNLSVSSRDEIIAESSRLLLLMERFSESVNNGISN